MVSLTGRPYDSHSSRRWITPALKLPTRTLREQHQRVPIWNCSRWRLPRFTVTEYARLCGPIPRLIPGLRPDFDGRPLTVTLSCGVRTFLPLPAETGNRRLSGLLFQVKFYRQRHKWDSTPDNSVVIAPGNYSHDERVNQKSRVIP